MIFIRAFLFNRKIGVYGPKISEINNYNIPCVSLFISYKKIIYYKKEAFSKIFIIKRKGNVHKKLQKRKSLYISKTTTILIKYNTWYI